MSTVAYATVRIVTDALCASEEWSRTVRRQIFNAGQPIGDADVAVASASIDEAISQLVSARAALNAKTVVEAL